MAGAAATEDSRVFDRRDELRERPDADAEPVGVRVGVCMDVCASVSAGVCERVCSASLPVWVRACMRA